MQTTNERYLEVLARAEKLAEGGYQLTYAYVAVLLNECVITTDQLSSVGKDGSRFLVVR